MTISEKIIEKLKEEYNAGDTQQDLATKYNLTQGQVQKLLSGQRDADGLRLSTLQKMFPAASISLSGASAMAVGNGNAVSTAGDAVVHNGSASTSAAQCDQCRRRLLDAVMSADLPAEAKVRLYEIVNGMQ